MSKAHKRDLRAGRLNISVSEAEANEFRRLAAEESARQGRIVTVAELIRRRVLQFEDDRVAA